ncbi:MAG: DNA-binding protein [Candidatus Zixiibacteriota bacterium]|nr:MAG: DNA-binding protein [candidate division Zixibacteria bacterium]
MQSIMDVLQAILAELRKSRPSPEREILDVHQAAEYLGQSEYTVREWVRMRKIPFNRVNGAIKFRRSRLETWIDRGEVKSRQ